MWEVIWESTHDCLKAIPILFLVYILVEFFSHKNGASKIVKGATKAGPVLGATLGEIPQCGFSGVMADLFSKKSITIGTIIAVFLATSDEAIPIMLSDTSLIIPMLILLAIKLVSAIVFGYLIDLIFFKKKKLFPAKIEEEKTCSCKECACECENHEHHEHTVHKHDACCADNIFLGALKHTAEIFAYLLVASIAINLLIFFIGIDKLNGFLGNGIWQVFTCGLLGLIPSCSVSVFLVEMFASQIISFAGMVAGLCSGAGVGLVILFVKNKNIKQNILITSLLFVCSVIVGIITFFICGSI